MIIAPSSAAPPGRGLYARHDIPAGTLLPGSYMGHNISDADYEQLLHDLQRGRHSIRYYRDRYGLHITCPHRYRHSRRTWARLAKGVSDYAFQGEDTVTILPEYTCRGVPTDVPDNPYMFMNEPPPTRRFFNRIRGDYQKSCVNVRPVVPSDISSTATTLHFEARTDIGAGDELFICYGPDYERPYEINMDTTCGCGQYDEIHGVLHPRITRAKYAALQRGPPPPLDRILSDEAREDSRTRKYVSRVFTGAHH